MDKHIRLMNEEEIETFRKQKRIVFKDQQVYDLEVALRGQLLIKQQTELRIEVLREVIAVKLPDNKSRQFKD